jgi:hypothetical protein
VGTTEKYPRYRWKEGREKDLRSFVDDRVQGGASVTAALKEYGKRHDMSWLTARWKYYQIRKRGMESPRTPGNGGESRRAQPSDAPFTRNEEDFLGYLAEFVTSTRDAGQDIVPFMKGVSRMAALSRQTTRLKQERETERAALREDTTALAEVCRFLEGWLNLPQVDRVGSLKAFSDQLAQEVARLATVRDRLTGA